MTPAEENPGNSAPEKDAQTEKVRLLVNDILERFNQEGVDPAEAGLAILALTHRLLEVLEEAPEARKRFISAMVNLINSALSEGFPGEDLGGML